MANEDNKIKVPKQIEDFFRISYRYYGKEISLNSNQSFSINQVSDLDNEQNGEYTYVIQYGFPNSGAVVMQFSYLEQINAFRINKITVYAPPAEKDFVIANFAPQMQVGNIDIRANVGLDTGTQEHARWTEIEANPNALKMLDMAILDLEQAQVLGECRLAVPQGSKYIPCCNSRANADIKEKSI